MMLRGFDIAMHFTALLLLPPLMIGLINRTKAIAAGRTGPPLLQPYFDILKLLRKGIILSRSTSFVFLAGPAVGLVATIAVGLLVPFGHHTAPVSFTGDMLALIYLLALGRMATILAALDTASAFEGMGAAREASFSALAEPALILGLIVMARLTGAYDLSGMFVQPIADGLGYAGAAMPLVAASWFIVVLAENCRIPFDDPNTHLELTMVHEVMVLDHSGPTLAVIEYAAAMKLFVMGALLQSVVVPVSTGYGVIDWAIFLSGSAVLAIVIGLVESHIARLRFITVPNLLICACLLSAFGVTLLLSVGP